MKANNISVLIDGKPILQHTNFQGKIFQEIGKHHFFEISFSTYLDEELSAIPFQNHEKYQNQTISILSEGNALEFTGIILSVQHFQSKEGKTSNMVIKGASLTILFEKSTQCQSFEQKMSFRQIITKTIHGYPSNLMPMYYGKETDLQLGYTVQYNESDWEFITRMSKRYGIYTYYDGEQLNIGKNEKTIKDWKGTVGVDIQKFNVSDNLEKYSFALQHKDWTTDHAFSSALTKQIPLTVVPTTKRADQVFTKSSTYYYPHLEDGFGGKQMLDYMLDVQSQGKLSRMVTAKGKTDIIGLSLCDSIEVKGMDYSNGLLDQPFGVYELTKITHTFDNHGHYQNEVEGIARGFKHPPYSDIYAIPQIEGMSAIVVDNNDTQGLNRLKVQFPWQESNNATTGWVRCANAHAGATHGSYIVAEKGDEVWCVFQGNNPERPLIVGYGFNQAAKSEFYNPDNDLKAIKTRSGNQIISNDKDGSITVSNKSGSTIVLEKDGNICVTAPETLTFISKNTIMQTKETIKILAQDLDIATEGNLNAKISGTLSMHSKGDTQIKSDSATHIESVADLHLKGQDIQAEGKSSASLKGKQTTVEGDNTEVKGAAHKIKIA